MLSFAFNHKNVSKEDMDVLREYTLLLYYSIRCCSITVYMTALLEYINLHNEFSVGLSKFFPERLIQTLTIATVCCAIHHYSPICPTTHSVLNGELEFCSKLRSLNFQEFLNPILCPWFPQTPPGFILNSLAMYC